MQSSLVTFSFYCCCQGLDFVKQLTAVLRKHCESCAPSLLDEFDAIFDAEDHHVGFIVNERIINIPPQISPPSFDALRYAVGCVKCAVTGTVAVRGCYGQFSPELSFSRCQLLNAHLSSLQQLVSSFSQLLASCLEHRVRDDVSLSCCWFCTNCQRIKTLVFENHIRTMSSDLVTYLTFCTLW